MAETNPLFEEWGKRIRELREARGLTQVALGQLAGIQQQNLSSLENGRVGLGDTARIRLASALGVQVEDIFTYPKSVAS